LEKTSKLTKQTHKMKTIETVVPQSVHKP